MIGDDVPVDDGPKGDVVGGWRDALLDELPVVLVPQALHHVRGVQHVAAHLVCQDPSVLGGLVVDGPAGQGGPALDNGLLEETCRGETSLSEAVPGDLFSGTVSPEVWWTLPLDPLVQPRLLKRAVEEDEELDVAAEAREMRAFISCIAWRAIPCPPSKHQRRLDSL